MIELETTKLEVGALMPPHNAPPPHDLSATILFTHAQSYLNAVNLVP